MNKGFCVWLTGLPAAGKTSIARELCKILDGFGIKNQLLDGDEFRAFISPDLGFSTNDRKENVERIAYVASLLCMHGICSVVACISPYESMRFRARKQIEIQGCKFVEVFVNTDLEECIRRDPKGLYAKAERGEITNMTGIDDPYFNPLSPDVTIQQDHNITHETVIQMRVKHHSYMLYGHLEEMGIIPHRRARALFIGRWQPFHNGHLILINEKLDQRIPVAIGVRDTYVSKQNKWSTAERIEMIEAVFDGKDVIVFSIPDINSFCYGREVGYSVEEYEPSEEVKNFSATEIRKWMEEGNDAWKGLVPRQMHSFLER